MKKFDIKNIKEEDIYVGDILIIAKTFKKLIEHVKKSNQDCVDLSPVCFREFAKEKAILIKVDENKYVDIDSIKNNRDIEIINELLNNGSIYNNIILKVGTIDPYVGELFIGVNTLKKVKIPNKILEKKLNTLN